MKATQLVVGEPWSVPIFAPKPSGSGAYYANSCRKIARLEGCSPCDIHLVLDNYGTHKHPKVKESFAAHPRYHLHFTPTSCSWLNLIERWFAEISRKRIRRGTFRSVAELIKAINTTFVKTTNTPSHSSGPPAPNQSWARSNTVKKH
jgi:transposase